MTFHLVSSACRLPAHSLQCQCLCMTFSQFSCRKFCFAFIFGWYFWWERISGMKASPSPLFNVLTMTLICPLFAWFPTGSLLSFLSSFCVCFLPPRLWLVVCPGIVSFTFLPLGGHLASGVCDFIVFIKFGTISQYFGIVFRFFTCPIFFGWIPDFMHLTFFGGRLFLYFFKYYRALLWHMIVTWNQFGDFKTCRCCQGEFRTAGSLGIISAIAQALSSKRITPCLIF